LAPTASFTLRASVDSLTAPLSVVHSTTKRTAHPPIRLLWKFVQRGPVKTCESAMILFLWRARD
jgi:hypothetical protein